MRINIFIASLCQKSFAVQEGRGKLEFFLFIGGVYAACIFFRASKPVW